MSATSSAQASRTDFYKNITIRKNITNPQQTTAEIDNEFRLVREAIDSGWYPNVTLIKIIGRLHMTTNHGTEYDGSHLTTASNPGDKKAHLYVNPDNAAVATPEITVDRVEALAN